MTDFDPQRDIEAISHVNVVVDDIEIATEFYGTVLGFERATNADGPMDYPDVDLASFARNAGFGDAPLSLDVRFLKHVELSLDMELFYVSAARGRPNGPPPRHERSGRDSPRCARGGGRGGGLRVHSPAAAGV